jgi:hypothetical protein
MTHIELPLINFDQFLTMRSYEAYSPNVREEYLPEVHIHELG